MKKFIIPLLLTFILFSCPNDNEVENKPVDVTVPSDIMGMVHAGSRTLITPGSSTEAQFDILDEIGVDWLLDDFTWSRIQPESAKDSPPEAWNWEGEDNYVKNANDRGKKILAILDYDTEWLHGGRARDGDGNYVTTTVKDHVGSDTNINVFNDGCAGRCVIGQDEIEKFCAYAQALVTRYNGKNGYGKVDAWRIWNEPNLYPRFWTGTMEQFYEFSVAVAAAIREADPDAVIVVGALNTLATNEWIRALYSSGATQDADFVSFHPYAVNAKGAASLYTNFKNNSPTAFHNRTWVTEIGNPTAPQNNYYTEVPEERMPQTIVKTITLLASQAAQKIFWYHLADGATRDPANSENWFGLYQRNADDDPVAPRALNPKGKLPDAYKLCAENIPGKTWRAAGLPGLDLPSSVEAHYFEGDDGKRCLVVWNDNIISSPTVSITLPGKNHVLYNLANNLPNEDWETPLAADNTYTLSPSDSDRERVLFFTWEE